MMKMTNTVVVIMVVFYCSLAMVTLALISSSEFSSTGEHAVDLKFCLCGWMSGLLVVGGRHREFEGGGGGG